jgi:hypothetical protein
MTKNDLIALPPLEKGGF